MRSALMCLAVVAIGCQGKIGDPKGGTAGAGGGGGQGGGQDPAPPACYTSDNDKIRLLLADTCQGCHAASSNRPFFASPEAFEDLLVYDAKYVVPGKPDESYLVQLLEGMGKDPYKQMPLNGNPFAVLDKNGLTKISLSSVKDWIANLPPINPRGASAAMDAPTTRRLTAEELLLGLRRLMGLPEVGLGSAGGTNGLMIRAPDAPHLDGECCDFAEPLFNPNGESHAAMRFEALGGPNTLAYRARVKDITPATLQLLVQVSQNWCSAAVGIAGNPALFKYASATSTSAKDADAIRKNLGYLHLRFLGAVPPGSAVDNLYNKVFLKYEAAGGSTAWTAVCAYLIRQPQFMLL